MKGQYHDVSRGGRGGGRTDSGPCTIVGFEICDEPSDCIIRV